MSFIPLLVVTLVTLVLYAVYFKLAALIFRRTRLSWGNSVLFALLMGLILFVTRAIPLLAPGQVPDVAISALGLVAGLSSGSWFFGQRARRPDGRALGWAGGFFLTLIGFALLIATGLLLILLVQGLHNI